MIQARIAASLLPAALIGLFGFASASRGDDKLQYNRDIRPILAENCFACHGPDSASRKAGLRLDQRDAAIQAGAIAPAKPSESEMIRRIHASGKEHMPPPVTKKVLTPAQEEKLARWIAQGAEYQKHWSLIAPTRPALPAVKNSGWVRNPIDRFILAKLEEKGLSPAPEADRRTLARRLSLDLTGLPPEPADVDAFVSDQSPDYYEKYVDKLLDSPHWGEHRGRYWLDAARYADSHGIHFDNYREMWAYRDWVIKAFNKNMKFDEFTIEQLAGDLLPNRSLDQLIASGFNRCNITTNEGGAIDEEYLVLYARDRTETVSQVWLGSTMGCCVCHDHKFDPFTMKDFYSMSVLFNNTTQRAMDGNIKDTPPTVFVPREEDRPKYDSLERRMAEIRKQIEDRKQAAHAEFVKWARTVKPESLETPVPTEGLKSVAELNEGKGKILHFTVDGKVRPVTLSNDIAWDAGKLDAKAYRSRPNEIVSLSDVGDFDGGQSFSYGAWVKLPRGGLTGAIFSRMDEAHDFRGWDLWVQNNMPGAHIVSKWQSDAVKAVATQQLKPKEWHHVFITYDGSGRAAGIKVYIDGAMQATTVEADSLRGSIKTNVPFKLSQRNQSSRIDGVALQDVRIYNRALSPREVEALARSSKAVSILKKPEDKRTDAEKKELYEWWLGSFDQPYREISKKLTDLAKEEGETRVRGTIAYVMQERPTPPEAYILNRGEYDKRKERVTPATPKSLPPMPAGQSVTRLTFAKWLLSPKHPLTARVTVNRFWQEVFGTGIVRTSGDFGVTGELPTNQELLDWMAVEFRESGWDIKKFFKMLVTSAAYRQASAATPEKLELDRDNRYLSRGPRFRMDAEMIRDYALAASDLLVRKVGGPSVKPYQPTGIWEAVAIIGSNTRDYRQDDGAKLYRRSLYTFWKRSAPPASMEIFNAPSRETCTVRRERTDTPLQALVTLNDPQFVEAARHLAELAMQNGDHSENCGIQLMAKRLLARNFRSDETEIVRNSLTNLLAYYKEHVDDAKKLIAVGESKPNPKLDPCKLAAWTMLANQLMNLDEVLNK